MPTLDFINVGYGDAVLVRDGAFTMLVDCGDVAVGDGGPGSARISAGEFLRREGVRKLDLLVLTHLHRDHSGGLGQVLETASVREFWTNYLPSARSWGSALPVPENFPAGARCLLESMNVYLAALKTLAAQGTAVKLMENGNAAYRLTDGLQAEVHLEEPTLHRRQAEIWKETLGGGMRAAALEELDRFINNTSIRLRLCCGEKTVELPGDVYADCWEKHDLAPCTIVKLPHHGHEDSVTPRLLEMLRPEAAVISVSNSRTDNCPAASVIRALKENRCRLFITDAVPLEGGTVPARHASVRFEL